MKRKWRDGIVVEGEPDRPASTKTPEGVFEAMRYLEKASLARDPDLRAYYLNQAMVVAMLSASSWSGVA